MPDVWEIVVKMIELTVATCIVAVISEAITEILVTSSLMDVIGLRPWAVNNAIPADGNYDNVRWYHRAIHKLLTCGYCVSVWSSFLLTWALPGDYFGLMFYDNFFLKAMLLHRLSNLVHVIYELCRRGRVTTVDLSIKHDVSMTHNERDE